MQRNQNDFSSIISLYSYSPIVVSKITGKVQERTISTSFRLKSTSENVRSSEQQFTRGYTLYKHSEYLQLVYFILYKVMFVKLGNPFVAIFRFSHTHNDAISVQLLRTGFMFVLLTGPLHPSLPYDWCICKQRVGQRKLTQTKEKKIKQARDQRAAPQTFKWNAQWNESERKPQHEYNNKTSNYIRIMLVEWSGSPTLLHIRDDPLCHASELTHMPRRPQLRTIQCQSLSV